MPRPRNTVPRYEHHKSSGRAYTRVPVETGGRKTVWLGKYGTAESREAYARLLAQISSGTPIQAVGASAPVVSVNAVLVRYIQHVKSYYPDHSAQNHLYALRHVRELAGSLPLRDFRPNVFTTIRQHLIDTGKLCRRTINSRMALIAQFIRWCVANELADPNQYAAIRAVPGLRAGRTNARESEDVKPVPDEFVTATLPHLQRHVAGMVKFQRLTGCRPGEACNLRWADIDKTGEVWVYKPATHKGAWRGKDRGIHVGPQAQALLADFPTDAPTDFVFSPTKATAEHLEARSAERKTKRYPSHMKRNAAKRAKSPERPPADGYTARSYARAVTRACEKAGVPHWHPNQLRHTRGTEVRRKYGLEGAQVTLGHATADITQLYAERDSELASRIAREIG